MILVIVGTGGFGREVLWAAERHLYEGFGYDKVVFVDDDVEMHSKIVCNREVVGSIESFLYDRKKQYNSNYKITGDLDFICGVGSPELRRDFVRRIEGTFGSGLFTIIVAESVNMSAFVDIGEGSVICAGTNITTQVKIGKHVNINLDCTVGHDVTIGDYTNISPGVHISGYVTIGKDVDIGTGANILPHIGIGDGAVVGAGACVTNDVPANSLVVGVPAKIKKQWL